MSYAARATAYARDVVEGRVPACRYVRLACQRHLDDLADPDSPYFYDEAAADRVAKYLELLPHVKGRWARERKTLKLEDWQCFAVCVPFGWKRKKDGLRRYRRTYVEVPRKNAKSTISAGLGLYCLTADQEEGAEVYSGAGTEAQAWEVFRPAKLMAERVEGLRNAFGLEVNAKTLVVPGTASRFAPIIGKPGDGASPHFAITDEYHEHATEEQYDTMITGMGARDQPMSWVITTAGADTAGPCYALRTEAIEVLEGKVDNPELFAIIYTIDDTSFEVSGELAVSYMRSLCSCGAPTGFLKDGAELHGHSRAEAFYQAHDPDCNTQLFKWVGSDRFEIPADDWTTEEALRKANPNIGVSVGLDYLKSQQRDAINNPRKQSTFKTKHMNVWVGAASPYFNLEKWNRLGDPELDAEQFVGEPCYMAVDLAAKLDITATGRLFQREIDGADHYYWFPRFYVPDEIASDPAKKNYAGWAAQGHLIVTDGNVTDFGRVQDDILADTEAHNVVHIAFDQWNSMQMSVSIGERTGVECIDLPMTVKHLSDPMKWVQALIEDGRLHHDGNPVMSWMVGNVTAQEDRNDNVFPRKEKPENKIDGAVALIMAMERGFQQDGERSYLETDEMVWLDL